MTTSKRELKCDTDKFCIMKVRSVTGRIHYEVISKSWARYKEKCSSYKAAKERLLVLLLSN